MTLRFRLPWLTSLFIALALAPVAQAAAPAPLPQESAADSDATPLIPRRVLFGNPDRTQVRISPDGRWISFLAPDAGVMNVWVAPAGSPDVARAVTRERQRGIRRHQWAWDGEHVLYTQDSGGDENWHVYAVDVRSAEVRDLTPIQGVQARILGTSPQAPGAIVVGINERDPAHHDLYRVDLATGERTLLVENPGYGGFLVDRDLRPRLASRLEPDGGETWFLRAPDGEWREWRSILPEDEMATEPLAFDASGATLYVTDSRGRDTSALYAVDLRSGERRLLAEDEDSDVGVVMFHPTRGTPQAVSFQYERPEWTPLDRTLAQDLARLKRVGDGHIEVVGRTEDDGRWVVAFRPDDGPSRYHLWDRTVGKAEFLFSGHGELEDLPLVPREPQVVTARDGLELVCYLSVPEDFRPATRRRYHVESASLNEDRGRVPLVLVVHGGPWSRDQWGYHPFHQWLANRGYAVLSVNFRGSTGFGKRFTNAGDLQWGARMHEDLLDACVWAVDAGIADPERIAILGGSYGGYATLAGLTMTPEFFACGVDIVGPSNLITLLESIPPYWAPIRSLFTTRMGNPDTEEGRALLRARSPLTHVERIERPLLIGQGANDPRVKQAESDQIVAAMKEREIPVTYVLFPDEGHGFARPENRLAFYGVAEVFLAQHLGGRAEPLSAADFAGSSATVPAGAGLVPGLEAALGAGSAPGR